MVKPSRVGNTSKPIHHLEDMAYPATVLKDSLTLEGHENSINVVRFSQDAEQLLAGDEDGYISVWDLRSGACIQNIDAANFGPVTTIVWIRMPLVPNNEARSDAFAAGSGNGNITLWKAVHDTSEFIKAIDAHEGPVEDITFDHVHYRLASTGAGYHQVWSLATSSLLQRIPPPPNAINPYICSSVHFCDSGASLLVTYTETHRILKYSMDPWALHSSNIVQTRIGNTHLEGDTLFIVNLKNGVGLYSAQSLRRIRHYDYIPKVNVSLQLSLARQPLDWVVIGGDDGLICIFDRNTGELICRLTHDSKCLVQTIDAISTHDQEVIAAAAFEVGRKSDIKIWYTKRPLYTSRPTWPGLPTSSMLEHYIRLAAAISVLGALVIALFAIGYSTLFLPVIAPAMQHIMQVSRIVTQHTYYLRRA